jgi:hypothetical protein
MHPSEWAKAIYKRRSRRDVAKLIGLALLCLLAVLLAHYLKYGFIF